MNLRINNNCRLGEVHFNPIGNRKKGGKYCNGLVWSRLRQKWAIFYQTARHLTVAKYYPIVISITSNSICPPGVVTNATSPRIFPSKPWPMGDVTEILNCLASASVSETSL